MADDDTESTETPDESADLEDAGKRALDAERRRARDADKRAKAAEARLKELEDAGKTELQRLQEALTEREAEIAELPRRARAQAVRFASEAARQGFVDPEDAFAFLPSDVDLDDADSVKAALTELAERKPHLVRKQQQPRVPVRPTATGGEHIGSKAGDDSAKERAAAALRAYRNS